MNNIICVERTEWIEAPELRPDFHQFVVGDIHGYADQLNSIIDEMSKFEQDDSEITFVGDIIDYGPDCIGSIINAVSDSDGKFIGKRRFIIGNHEVFMIRATFASQVDNQDFNLWRNLASGHAMITQFENENTTIHTIKNDIAMEIARRIGRKGELDAGLEILDQIWFAPTYLENGNILMVHGGLNPEIDKDNFLAWMDRDRSINEMHMHTDLPINIRYDFLDYKGPFKTGHFVVHGHTPEHITGPKEWGETPGIWHHVVKGHRLSLDGHYQDDGAVIGAEILPGKYRIYRAQNSNL